MTEWLDVLDEHGRKTGKIMKRDDPFQPGFYMAAVHVVIRDRRGRYLIQLRSKNKRYMPGQWDVTAGAVGQGETAKQAAVREIKEELGLMIPLEKPVKIGRIKRTNSFLDVWLVRLCDAKGSIVLERDEVDAVKWVTYASFKKLIEMLHANDPLYVKTVIGYLETMERTK